MTDATIFAVSSGQPPVGVCIIRVSGPQAGLAIEQLTGAGAPTPRKMVRRRVHAPNQPDALIDDALMVWFPAPASFTGEDCVEFHVHGGRAVVAAVLAALSSLSGFALAEPGAFSRRAFENGKLDLSEAEGLADLIAAETEAQRKQALRQLEGRLGSLCLAWQHRLKSARAHMEATIDFSDEELPDSLDEGARGELGDVLAEIIRHLDDGGRGELVRDGVRIAILGPPNAGKSSLLNYLAARDAAIVSEQAGTTRDVIEVHLDLGGYPAIVADTAGLRDSDDVVEQEGVRRAMNKAEAADIRLVIFDGAHWPNTDPMSAPMTAAMVEQGAIGIVNKIDLIGTAGAPEDFMLEGKRLYGISVKTGDGIDTFLSDLTQNIASRVSGGDNAVVTRARHREALRACCDHLQRCLSATGSEFWAEDLRLAMRALGRVVGQVGVEDVLDIIFSEFCIGK